jgi:quinol monooxygenase YgiN
MAPVTYLIIFDVVPDRHDEFLELLSGVLDAMRSESTFCEAILHRDPDRKDRFMLYETWESHEDVLEVQLARPYRKAWHDALPRLLQRERDVTIWQPLRSDRASNLTATGR